MLFRFDFFTFIVFGIILRVKSFGNPVEATLLTAVTAKAFLSL
jgi:hypothetical protein